jgi:hypothetical protein
MYTPKVAAVIVAPAGTAEVSKRKILRAMLLNLLEAVVLVRFTPKLLASLGPAS